MKTLVIVLNALFGAAALALIAIGVTGYRVARRSGARRARWLALACGVLLSAAAIAAFAMAVTLNREREPLWLVTVWLLAAFGFAVIAVRDFAAGAARQLAGRR